MKFRKIPQLTPNGSYYVNVGWRHLKSWLDKVGAPRGLVLNPDFQRGHVWSKKQQSAYLEYILRGGAGGKDIYFNYPSWHFPVEDGKYNEFVCVDGLQRISAVLSFLNNEITVLGGYFKDYTDHIPLSAEFIFHVNDLKSKEEVLQWYLDLNFTGTPHSEEELYRVRSMLFELNQSECETEDNTDRR